MRYVGGGRRLARGALIAAAAVAFAGFGQPGDWISGAGSRVVDPGVWAKDGQAYLEKARGLYREGQF